MHWWDGFGLVRSNNVTHGQLYIRLTFDSSSVSHSSTSLQTEHWTKGNAYIILGDKHLEDFDYRINDTDTLGRPVLYVLYTVSQKGTSVLLSITLANINRFSIFFIVEFDNKFATKFLLHCPPHLKCVTALPCELKIVNFVILQA